MTSRKYVKRKDVVDKTIEGAMRGTCERERGEREEKM